ncbi:hypothetical protein F5X98DRAFT_30419 [Xylaria grammica]|nr:hypothetical protein F5X98DRAFT_30419 [Xylaria grammica]
MDRIKSRLGHIGHSRDKTPIMAQNELILVDPGKDANIDIVFLPRFGAQGLSGWTAKDQGNDVIWPKDFLTADIPKARILAYGYHADANFWDYKTDASHLCGQLKQQRSGDSAPRPIVFVAHSLGGILAAQVVVGGDPSISKCVQGLVLFGTPFQRKSTLGLSDILESIAKLYRLPKDGFGGEIQTLGELSKRLSDKDNKIKFRPFSEEQEGLVNKEAATVPGISTVPPVIAEDHDNLCKFNSKRPWYACIIGDLKELAKVETDEAANEMTNNGHIGTYVRRDVHGGVHNNNGGSVVYGQNNYHGTASESRRGESQRW